MRKVFVSLLFLVLLACTVCYAVGEESNLSSADMDRSISILTQDLSVAVGKHLQIKADITRLSETAPLKSSIQWSTSDPDIANVSANGSVTGIAPGSVEIVCSLKDNPEIKASVRVRVFQPVKSIKPQSGELRLLYGASEEASRGKISVNISPENATDHTCLYSSSNESVVTVDAEGNVRAVSPGKAKITILPADGTSGVKATCNITVGQAVTAVSIPAEQKLDVKKKFTFKPGFLPADATWKSVEYTSSDPSVATVSSNGTVTALKCGETTITARALDGSGASADCLITVVQMVKSIKIDKVNLRLEYRGSYTLKASVLPDDVTDNTVIWESSDTKIVTVNSITGLVKAVNPGTATITCYARDGSEVKASVKVTVEKYKAKTKNGKLSDGIPAENYYNMKYSFHNELKSGSVEVQSITAQALDNGYIRFTMSYNAPAGYMVYVFSPPNGNIFGFTAKKRTVAGEDTIQFEIYAEDLEVSRFVTINIVKSDKNRFFIFPELDAGFKQYVKDPNVNGISNSNT